MLLFSLEEFAPRKRGAQERIEAALREDVKRALDGDVNTDGYRELVATVREQWALAYAEDAETAKAMPKRLATVIKKTLAKTDRAKSDDNTIDRITVWLSTMILSTAAIEAANDDPEDLMLEWVTLHDNKVRTSHKDTEGQQRPVGVDFKVGPVKMPYPGYPGVDPEFFMNCRCVIRPILASEATAELASWTSTTSSTTPSQVPTAASTGPALSTTRGTASSTSPVSEPGRPTASPGSSSTASSPSRPSSTPARTVDASTSSTCSTGLSPDSPRLPTPSGQPRLTVHNSTPMTSGTPGMARAGTAPSSASVESANGSEPMPSASLESADPPDETPGESLAEPTHAGVAVVAHDTNRILMIQRSLDQDDAPDVQGTWEIPGGGIEEGENAEAAAWREFCEETGLPQPDGETVNGWRSEDGVYQGFVYAVPFEAEAFDEINPDIDAQHVENPDNPERRHPDVTAWFTIDQIKGLGPALRPECRTMDWTLFDLEAHMTENAPEVKNDPDDADEKCIEWDDDGNCTKRGPSDEELDAPEFEGETVEVAPRMEWHSVWTVEGKPTGDKRTFKQSSLRGRPLPLPIGWQKFSAPGHEGNVTVGGANQLMRVGHEIRASGFMLATVEADEVMAMVAEFGRFGISIDADDASFSVNEETGMVEFTDARACGATIVPIPAFHEAWFRLGPPPEDFYEGGTELGTDAVEEVEAPDEALVASGMFADIAPGKTEDGPGWLTHPVDTDRLRDYWVRGEGAAKIAWGTPGDFNRCRVNLAKYIKPQYLSGYCANRHFDALGIWPGEHMAAADNLTETDPADMVSLVASVSSLDRMRPPAAWFANPEFDRLTPMHIDETGRVSGHLAGWNICHASVQNKCILAPKSMTNYAHFLLGEVLTKEGTYLPVGTLSIGGGHADTSLRMRPTLDHYDNTSTAWAYVNVGEDKFGIWFSGWCAPSVTEETLIEARASKISGDWRDSGGNLELCAALSVNTPGFRVQRVAASVVNGRQISLVAAGIVEPEPQEPKVFGVEDVKAAVHEVLAERDQVRAGMARLKEISEVRAKMASLAREGV